MIAQAGLVALVVALGVLTQYEVDHDVLLAEKGLALPVPRAKAFQFIINMKLFPKWVPGVESFEPIDNSPMQVGKHFTEVQSLPIYGDLIYDNLVIAYECPRYISFISDSWLLLRVEIQLDRRDNPAYPTAFHWKIYSRRRSFLFNYVAAPVLRFVYSHKSRQAMFNLSHMF